MYSALDQYGNANALQGPAPSQFDPSFGSAYSNRTQIRAGRHGGLPGGARRVGLSSAHQKNRLMFDPNAWFDADRGALTTRKTGSVKVPYTGEVIETYENRLLPGTTDRYSHNSRTLGRAGSHLRMQRRVIQRRDAKVSTYRPAAMRGAGRITTEEAPSADREMARKATRYLKTSISSTGDHEFRGPGKISDRSGPSVGGYDYRLPFDSNASRVYDPKLFVTKKGATVDSRAPRTVLEPKSGFDQRPCLEEVHRDAPVRRQSGKVVAVSRRAYGESGGEGTRFQQPSQAPTSEQFEENTRSRRGKSFMQDFMRTKNVTFVECAYVKQPPPSFRNKARKFSVDPSKRSALLTDYGNAPRDPHTMEFNKKTKVQRSAGSENLRPDPSTDRTLQLMNIAKSALALKDTVAAAKDSHLRSSRGLTSATKTSEFLQGGGIVGVTVSQTETLPETHEISSRRGEHARDESEFKKSGAPMSNITTGDAPIPGDREVPENELTTTRGQEDAVVSRMANLSVSDGTSGSCRVDPALQESESTRGTENGVGVGSASRVSVPPLSIPSGKAGTNESVFSQLSDSKTGRVRTKRESTLPPPLHMGNVDVRSRSGKIPSIVASACVTDRAIPGNVTVLTDAKPNGSPDSI